MEYDEKDEYLEEEDEDDYEYEDTYDYSDGDYSPVTHHMESATTPAGAKAEEKGIISRTHSFIIIQPSY